MCVCVPFMRLHRAGFPFHFRSVPFFLHAPFDPTDSLQGPHEKRLLNNLLNTYNTLERPVANESDPLEVKFGLTLQQIIDVVSMLVPRFVFGVSFLVSILFSSDRLFFFFYDFFCLRDARLSDHGPNDRSIDRGAAVSFWRSTARSHSLLTVSYVRFLCFLTLLSVFEIFSLPLPALSCIRDGPFEKDPVPDSVPDSVFGHLWRPAIDYASVIIAFFIICFQMVINKGFLKEENNSVA